MFGGDASSDKALQKLVNRRLERSGGGSQSGMSASVQHGAVTLTGKLQYEAQRQPILKALRGVAGVRSVVDQLRLTPKNDAHNPQRGGA